MAEKKPKNSGKPWAAEDETKLGIYARRSMTTAMIAKLLWRSTGAIRGKASELKISLMPRDR